MSFAEVVKAFLEIGILGVCSVLMIVTYYDNHKRGHKVDDKKNDILEDSFNNLNTKLDTIINNITEQNNRFVEFQAKQSEKLMNTIINGVVNHVPSQEESSKLESVSNNIDTILQEIVIETNASRACLVQYHNGGKGINHQAFLKMSMTNEKTQLGIKSIMSECKDQFRSALGYFVNEINNCGHCCILDINEIKGTDIGMYELMLTRGIEAKCGYAIHNKTNNVIAYICVEFENKEDAKKEIVRKSFMEHYREVERLLNL